MRFGGVAKGIDRARNDKGQREALHVPRDLSTDGSGCRGDVRIVSGGVPQTKEMMTTAVGYNYCYE